VRERALARGVEARFIADAMLGKLARWLRLLGFDCAFEPHIPDRDLVHRACQEDRILLTRDRRLPTEWRISDVHLVEAETTFEQLAEVIHAFQLGEGIALFTRCSECNTPLVEAEGDERAPAGILARHAAFKACPGCDRLYWEGSHTRRIRGVAEALLALPE